MTTYRKKFIEVALPLDAINRESAREKSIRHGHRRPNGPDDRRDRVFWFIERLVKWRARRMRRCSGKPAS